MNFETILSFWVPLEIIWRFLGELWLIIDIFGVTFGETF